MTNNRLDSIKVLYRQNDTLTLWGIPYDMKVGQNPQTLFEDSQIGGWIYLNEDDEDIREWIETLDTGILPLYPNEWCPVDCFQQ